ncbi:MAG: PAS domain-containing protein [Rubrivivax sp.]|nr:PAS domain-containing protein [Rubrivivax sp.]
MPPAVRDVESILDLRERALTHMRDSAPRTADRANPTRALAALHTLASSPETAGDALALLHELQLHQVELELQHEELRRSLVELESALGRQTARVDHAPVAFLTLDATTRLCELNPAAARLLGASVADLQGQPLTRFLSPRSATALFTLLARVLGGAAPQRCELHLAADHLPAPTLLALASADPLGGHCLVALVDLHGRESIG